MGQTLAEQIISHAAGRSVVSGDIVVVRPDVVMSHDSLTPSIIDIFHNEFGKKKVFDSKQLVFTFDHVSPASTIGTADGQNKIRTQRPIKNR